MTACRYCATPGAYDSGFTVECVNSQCGSFSLDWATANAPSPRLDKIRSNGDYDIDIPFVPGSKLFFTLPKEHVSHLSTIPAFSLVSKDSNHVYRTCRAHVANDYLVLKVKCDNDHVVMYDHSKSSYIHYPIPFTRTGDATFHLSLELNPREHPDGRYTAISCRHEESNWTSTEIDHGVFNLTPCTYNWLISLNFIR